MPRAHAAGDGHSLDSTQNPQPAEAHPRSGNHVPGGLYIVAGPAQERWQSGDIDICDLARVFLEAAD